MKIELRLRAMSAYFDPAQFFVADNEAVTIRLVDRGTINGKAYLQVNRCVFAYDENKELQLNASELKEINVCELQLRNEKGTVTKRWVTENLFHPPIDRSVDGEYYETQTALLSSVKALATYTETLQKQLADLTEAQATNAKEITDLKNGKFTMFKFRRETE